MKRFLSNIISSAIYRAERFVPLAEKGLRILTYHRIGHNAGDRLSVTPEEFEKQMGWLKGHGYTGVSVRDGLASLRGIEIASPPSEARNDKSSSLRGKVPGDAEAIPIPCKDRQIPIAITFDDGYQDNYSNALPILKKYGFSATVYVIAGFVGTDKTLLGYGEKSRRTFLNWEEIRLMAQEKIEVGSHTMTHPRLTTVNRKTAESELRRSREEIEAKLDCSCASFCYPGGMWNKQLEELVRQAGYHNAVTVMPGANSAGGHFFRLKRTEISGDDSLFEFKKKLSGAYDLLHAAWQKAGNLK